MAVLAPAAINVDTNNDLAIALPFQFMGRLSNTNPYCNRSATLYNPSSGTTVQAVINILSYLKQSDDVIREISVGETFVLARDGLHISKCPSSSCCCASPRKRLFQAWSTGPYSSMTTLSTH